MTQITSKQNKTAIEEAFLKKVDLFAQQTSNSYLKSLRKDAITSLEQLGLPGNKSEEYKYTRITRELDKAFSAEDIDSSYESGDVQEEITKLIPDGLEANILIFVNGAYNESLSKIISPSSDINITLLSEAFETYPEVIEQHFGKYADYKTDAFTALNTALASEGVFIHVPKGKVIEIPTLIYFISDTTKGKVMTHPRNLYVAEENSQVNITESFYTLGEAEGFNNIVSEIEVEKHAVVNYQKIEIEGAKAYHTGTTHVQQVAESLFNAVTIALSGGMIRNNLNLVLDAEHCESHMYGLYMLDNSTHVDNHTMVDHRKPNSFSNELYKGVMDDQSKGVFNGKIYVRPDAQKTNAFQSNMNILLTDEASIDTKPQLEIWADDVKCSHGATTGQIDAEQLFYLETRGLKKRQAKALLLKAFANDVIQNIKVEPLQEMLEQVIESRLEKDL